MGNYEMEFMQIAVHLSEKGMHSGEGGPFGAIVVKNNEIIGRGYNSVLYDNDPTAHAEIVAIRKACKKTGGFQLEGCEIYTSCEPCPMCMGAIYWAHIDKVYYANTRTDAAHAGFDDSFIYKEINLPIGKRTILMQQLNIPDAIKVFKEWGKKADKMNY